MKKYGQAAIMEMFFDAWPKAVEAASKPLEKVDSITMYGDGNNNKLISDIINSTSQVNAGLKETMGVDLQSILSGFIGGSIANKKDDKEKE